MHERWLRCAFGAMLVFAVVNFLSCMHERKLVAIAIQPLAFTFPTPDPAAQGVFTALGSYIHPPDTRDITDQVTWKTDVPQLLQIDKGVVSPQPGKVCGIADVSASMNEGGNLVIGYATVIVNDPTNPLCPGGSQTKGIVTVAVTGSGTVTSSPSGISCPGQNCGAQFNVGDTIVLTGTPTGGATSVSWAGCDLVNGTTCSVLVQQGSIGITATFN